MARKGTPSVSDDELQAIVNQRLNSAVGGNLDSLTTDRAEAVMMYDGLKPPRRKSDHTGYVSNDVLEAVEARKATLLETFTGNVKPVQFVPTGQQDIPEAMQATNYVDNVVFNQNDGYFILHDTIHDALLGRVGVNQVWWRKDIAPVPQQVTLPDQQSLAVFLQSLDQSTVSNMQIVMDEDQETGQLKGITASYDQMVDRGQVVIEVVPTEEFFISPRATSLQDADIVARRQLRSYAEMKQQGYDVGPVDDWASNDIEANTDYSKAVRFWDVDSGIPVMDTDDYHKKTSVADCYIKLDVDGVMQLWHVVLTGNRVLHKEQVNQHPFEAFVPMRVPHRFYGMSFAGLLKWVQENNTLLTRAVVNHAMITTNPRYSILRGALPNPKELIDNRLGGIVNISRPDAISPLNQPNLNPFVFQTIQKLTADKETITGTTQLSQGLNKDALSSQNSADLVNQMASMGLGRAKMMARNLERYLANLYKHVYQLVLENEKSQRIVQVNGSFVPVDPSKWMSGRDVHVKFSVGYGEKEQEAMRLFQFDQYASAQQGMGGMYGTDQRYNVWEDIFNSYGFPNVSRYLISPDQVKPPQPDPAKVAEMQIKQQEAQVKAQDANTRAMKVQSSIVQAQDSAQRKTDHLNAQQALKAQDMMMRAEDSRQRNLLDAAQLHGQMAVNAAQLHLEERSQDIKAEAKPVPVGDSR